MLAKARQDAGLSVEDISSSTRIRAGLIRSIEADQFGPCGGAVYARGHIRSIARAIGADPEPLVAAFDAVNREEAPPVPVPAQVHDPELVARAERRPQPNWTAAMVVALAAICVLAGIGLATGRHHKPGGSTPSIASSPAASKPAKPVASPPPSAVAQLPADATALVRITGDRSWLQVETLAGRLLYSGVLAHGQTLAPFRDHRGLRLWIGNAPAVQLVLDGREVALPASANFVVHVTVQPGGDVRFA
jgi:cytoskeletal protein RodZ